MKLLKVNRIKAQVDYDQIYQVYIDNRFVMDIENGQIKDFPIAVGKHTIQVRSSIYKSEVISFDIGDGEIIEFKVQPDYKNNWFSKFLHHTIYGKQGLKLFLSQDFYI